MKKVTKLFILLIAIFSYNAVLAQETTSNWPKDYPKPGGYGQNPNLQKFVGTWQWQSGDTVFTIVLKKYISKSNKKTGRLKDYSKDAIMGWHEYIIGEKVVESSLKNIVNSPNKNTIKTMLGGSIDDVRKVTNLFFLDLSKSKNGIANLELLPGEKDLARWTLRETSGIKLLGPGEKPDYTFTVPTNVVMKRIKNKNKDK